MCVWNKRVPQEDAYTKTPTKVVAPGSICEELRRAGDQGHCTKDHAHSNIQGSVKFEGRSMAVSEWAGAYTAEFATALLTGAE